MLDFLTLMDGILEVGRPGNSAESQSHQECNNEIRRKSSEYSLSSGMAFSRKVNRNMQHKIGIFYRFAESLV